MKAQSEGESFGSMINSPQPYRDKITHDQSVREKQFPGRDVSHMPGQRVTLRRAYRCHEKSIVIRLTNLKSAEQIGERGVEVTKSSNRPLLFGTPAGRLKSNQAPRITTSGCANMLPMLEE